MEGERDREKEWDREKDRERENPADDTTSQPPCAAQSPSIHIYAPDEREKKRRRKIHVNILSKIKGERKKKNSEIIKTLFMILRSTNIVICLALNMRMFVASGLLIKWFYPAATLENGVVNDGRVFFALLEQISSGAGHYCNHARTANGGPVFGVNVKQCIDFLVMKNSVAQ